MADDETPQEDRTEAPSHKRLEKAFDEGSVPLGKEFNAVAGFAAGTAALVSLGGPLQKSLIRLVTGALDRVGGGGADAAHSLGESAPPMPRTLVPPPARPPLLTAAVGAAAAVAGSLSYIVQT